MKANNKLVHYKGYEQFIARIDDYLIQAYNKGVIITPFYSPNLVKVLERYIGNQAFVESYGGYQNAENKRVRISYQDFNDEFKIAMLKATFNKNYNDLKHKDVLGALMNLGIKRENFGDIVIIDNTIYIYVVEKVKDFIIENLTKIKRAKITFIESNELINYEKAYSYKEVIIKSKRLDAIVASITNSSRLNSKKMVENGLVKVDYEVLEDASLICDNKSVISIRGFGRFVFIDLERVTKNNNYLVKIGKVE